MQSIKGFFKEYRWLSNFYPSPIKYEGLFYSSVEQAYQAAKTLDEPTRVYISLLTASESKKEGKKVQLRPDWENIKLSIMEDLLRLKFANPDLCHKLVSTGNAYLEETNWWVDKFWGVCREVGENHLGKLLMKIREEMANDKN